jgi:4-hydroxy-3-methylbut-2-enyl diphosphate reductase
MIKVEIDRGAGFCFGVEEVIQTAEAQLKKGKRVVGLGEMVHNSTEMKRLHDLGFKTIQHAELGRQESDLVLFRAHGEPPSTYKTAAANQVQIIDGTCPIVLKLQERIRKAYASMDHQKQQLVIFGKREHPETIGLLGQVDGDAVVVSSVEEASLVDPDKAVLLFSQTTMDVDQFEALEKALKDRLSREAVAGFRSKCTICGQMKKRKPGLKSFAAKHDVLVFVSGKNSSNGKLLFEYCRSLNPLTYWISASDEMQKNWFKGAHSIGVTGATSTSMNQLESVGTAIKSILE